MTSDLGTDAEIESEKVSSGVSITKKVSGKDTSRPVKTVKLAAGLYPPVPKNFSRFVDAGITIIIFSTSVYRLVILFYFNLSYRAVKDIIFTKF